MRIKALAWHHGRWAWQVNLGGLLHYGNDLGGTSNRPPPAILARESFNVSATMQGGGTSRRRLVWIFGDVSLPVF